MKSTPKWLLIPPVVAALLVLGPLAMSSGASAGGPNKTAATPARQKSDDEGTARRVAGSLVPKTPDMWKMSSALVGVLLLGAGGLLVLKKLRGGVNPTGNTTLATLRQTVRLSAKQSLHAIEFDDRILLVGEGDKGLTLIDRGSLPDAVSDEATVLARHKVDAVAGDDDDEFDDDGAVPKNLVIPRPDRAPQKQSRPAQTPSSSKADKAIATLNDFRKLLQKAGR